MGALARLLAGALLLPAASLAAIPPSTADQVAYSRFKTLDADHDGGLSRAELLSRGRERAADTLFLMLDQSGAGRVALADYAHAPAPVLARLRAFDANHDGVVTRQEFPRLYDEVLFQALDADRDGRLSLAELRPRFAGAKAREAKATPQPQQLRRQHAPDTRPVCWVPMPPGGEVRMVMPVTGVPCRTVP